MQILIVLCNTVKFNLKKLVLEKGAAYMYHIEPAAVSDEEYGNPIYPPAKRCLSHHGVQFDSSKTARTITNAGYDRFDRINCMDSIQMLADFQHQPA